MIREFYKARLDAPLRDIARYLDTKADDFTEAWQENCLFPVHYGYESTFEREAQPGQIWVWRYWEQPPSGTYWIMESKLYCAPAFSVWRELDWYTIDAGHVALIPGRRKDKSDTWVTIMIDNPLFQDYWQAVKDSLELGYDVIKDGCPPGSGCFKDNDDFIRQVTTAIKETLRKKKDPSQARIAAAMNISTKTIQNAVRACEYPDWHALLRAISY